LDWSRQPSASERLVVVVLVLLGHRLWLAMEQRVGVLRAVAAAGRKAMVRAAHAVLVVLVVTDSLSSTKSSRYEQSVRHPWWHRPQHYRP
jgi:hypothetical protein